MSTLLQQVITALRTVPGSRPCGSKCTLTGYNQDTIITVSMKDLVQTIEQTHGPAAAVTILNELGVSYNPGKIKTAYGLERTRYWDEMVHIQQSQKQPIATAPMDGTIIMGYWEGDPDPRPHAVRYSSVYKEWILEGGEEHGEDTIAPSHWSLLQ